MSDTPETDSKTNATFGNHSCATVLADFARKLERERDEARAERDILRFDAQREAEHHDRMVGELEKVYAERDEARNEIKGWKNKFDCAVDMGARAENELAKLKEAAKSVVEVWETPPWKIGETPSKAIAQLKEAIRWDD
jgi:hypothetical protein